MRLLVRYAPIVLLAAMAVAAVSPRAGIPAWLKLERDRQEAELRISSLQASLKRIEEAGDVLRDDEFELERAIRTDLKLARPGEVIVIVEPPADEKRRAQ